MAGQRDDGLHRALANDFVPMMMARLWSCNAPATISDAEAEPFIDEHHYRDALGDVVACAI